MNCMEFRIVLMSDHISGCCSIDGFEMGIGQTREGGGCGVEGCELVGMRLK